MQSKEFRQVNSAKGKKGECKNREILEGAGEKNQKGNNPAGREFHWNYRKLKKKGKRGSFLDRGGMNEKEDATRARSRRRMRN